MVGAVAVPGPVVRRVAGDGGRRAVLALRARHGLAGDLVGRAGLLRGEIVDGGDGVVAGTGPVIGLVGLLGEGRGRRHRHRAAGDGVHPAARLDGVAAGVVPAVVRSEELTSELQSLMRISYAVFCLKHKNAPNRYN